jgi:hypothetical protein
MANFPYPIATGTARDQAGKAFGISGRTVDAGTRVLNRGSEKLTKAVDDGKLVDRAVKV